MSKKKWITLLLGLIILLSVYGLMRYRANQHPAAENNAVAVKTEKVALHAMPIELKSVGSLVARSIEITPEISGHVKKILFQDGQDVAAGAALIQFNDAVYSSQYESAKAKWEFSESDYKRKLYLSKQGVISQQAIDQAQSERKERKANVDEAMVMLTKMRLKAPFAGVVSKSKVNVGDYVTTGKGIVTLTDLNHLRIEYDVPEQYLSQIAIGQSVEVMTSTYPGKRFNAKVAYVSPTINIQNRSISLYASLNNLDHRLKPGMFVNVRHQLGQDQQHVIIPARSLVPVLEGEQVYKIVDNKAIPTIVTVGKHNNNEVQILSGLVPGDVIVTDGQLKLRNGINVKIDT